MPALDETLEQKLSLLEGKQQKRILRETVPLAGVQVQCAGRTLISFSGNDYLGLSQHPQVIAVAKAALERYGSGAGASRLVTGNHPFHHLLETALASYKGTAAACIFGSGYLANLGTISALVGKGDLILADKFAHACMIDAAKLSGATLLRFAHNDLAHCRLLLETHRARHLHCLILTETVFSMDGDLAPLGALKQMAESFDAWLMTDDAHGLGVLSNIHNNTDIQMGTLSKAVGGYGGYVCGSQMLIDYLINSARSLVFSTALPPATVAACAAAIAVIASEPELVKKPLQHAQYFTSLLNLPKARSAIVPVMLHDNDRVLAASALLEERGFLVAAIRPPTVPENTARLRFAFSALHEPAQIEAVAAVVREQEWV